MRFINQLTSLGGTTLYQSRLQHQHKTRTPQPSHLWVSTLKPKWVQEMVGKLPLSLLTALQKGHPGPKNGEVVWVCLKNLGTPQISCLTTAFSAPNLAITHHSSGYQLWFWLNSEKLREKMQLPHLWYISGVSWNLMTHWQWTPTYRSVSISLSVMYTQYMVRPKKIEK